MDVDVIMDATEGAGDATMDATLIVAAAATQAAHSRHRQSAPILMKELAILVGGVNVYPYGTRHSTLQLNSSLRNSTVSALLLIHT